MDSEKNKLLKTLFGLIGSMFVGLFFFKMYIFDIHKVSFQFLIYGLYGSVYFVYGNTLKNKLILFAGFVLIDILLIGKNIYFEYVISHIVSIGSLLLAIQIYAQLLKSYRKMPLFIRSFVLSIANALTNILSVLILYILFNRGSGNLGMEITVMARFGALIGLGLGLGFDLFKFVKQKKII